MPNKRKPKGQAKRTVGIAWKSSTIERLQMLVAKIVGTNTSRLSEEIVLNWLDEYELKESLQEQSQQWLAQENLEAMPNKMDDTTRARLENWALAIARFQDLPANEQEWLYPLLSRSVRSCVDLLRLIDGERLTYYDIGFLLGMSPYTASQKVNALIRGGISIDADDKGAVYRAGRPCRIISR